MFVVDTNILLYAANKSAPEHETCRNLVERWRREGRLWYITWGIACEFPRVAAHPKVFFKPWNLTDAWSFIQTLTASPGLHLLVETDRHSSVAQEVFEEMPDLSGNLLFDTHTAILMKENGIAQNYTHDADFRRFSFLETIDPLR